MNPDLLPVLTLAADAAHTLPGDVVFWSGAGLMALLTLTALEVVLGIDNVVFIAILAGRLPEKRQIGRAHV